jgi:tetratricopeptide (TPR) repeat protein
MYSFWFVFFLVEKLLKDTFSLFFHPQLLTISPTLAEASVKIDHLFEQIFLCCLRQHQPEGIAYEATLESLLQNDFFSAIRSLRKLLRMAESQGFQDEILSKIHLLSGQLYSEFGQHADAIESLTAAIAKDPLQKEAFLERAISHFELGQFDLSVEDYLHFSDQGPKTIDPSFVDFCGGCISGILEKGLDASIQFLPEALGSLKGIAQGLWAFGTNPLEVSQDFVIAAKECVHFIKTHATSSMVQQMVPELQELIRSYSALSDHAQGRLMGEVIGKYGIEILFTGGIVSTVKTCKNLKRANAIMTLEALASPSRKGVILKEAAKKSARRTETLKVASKKIHEGQQGKHIVGHNNYTNVGSKSIFEHKDPQGLCDNFAGTGIKANNGVPGMAGYRERVNFKEIIGTHVDPITEVKTPTTWGIIHYGKDGVHIVPSLPPGQ